MAQIIALLQSAILLLTAVLSSPVATPAQKQSAISFAQNAVIVAKSYLAPVTVIKTLPKGEEGCRTDPQYGRIECAPVYINHSPIVFLEGRIEKSDGTVMLLKGINRDSALKQLSTQRENIKEINPYYVRYAYATSSLSQGDRVSFSIHFNPNMQKDAVCRDWDNKSLQLTDTEVNIIPSDQVKSSLEWLLKSPYDKPILEQTYGIRCNSTTTLFNTQVINDNFWDTITIDYVP